jgi:acyl dehydratase
MSEVTLASRTFSEDDQTAFAGLSGDFNPVHMHPIAARRTQAGSATVPPVATRDPLQVMLPIIRQV